MKHRKHTLLLTGLLCFLIVTTAKAENENTNVHSGDISIGYRVDGNENTLRHGVAARWWADDRWGAELLAGVASVDEQESSNDTSTWDLGLKGMYSIITKEHSRFYGFAEAGITQDTDGNSSSDSYIIHPGIGFEYTFKEIPEVGFDVEIGYLSRHYDWEGGDENDSHNQGTSIGFGWHYYF